MNIDTKKLKDECRREMEQAYREGWKAGYLYDCSVSPYSTERLRLEWYRGWDEGVAERAKDEAKVKAKEAQ